jgi:hypothetical protein
MRMSLFYSLFFNILLLFISQRRKQRRKRRRETLMMKHLKRVTMVMKRDGNSIISPIRQIGSSHLSTFLMLSTVSAAHTHILFPLIQIKDVVAKLMILKFAVSC